MTNLQTKQNTQKEFRLFLEDLLAKYSTVQFDIDRAMQSKHFRFGKVFSKKDYQSKKPEENLQHLIAYKMDFLAFLVELFENNMVETGFFTSSFDDDEWNDFVHYFMYHEKEKFSEFKGAKQAKEGWAEYIQEIRLFISALETFLNQVKELDLIVETCGRRQNLILLRKTKETVFELCVDRIDSRGTILMTNGKESADLIEYFQTKEKDYKKKLFKAKFSGSFEDTNRIRAAEKLETILRKAEWYIDEERLVPLVLEKPNLFREIMKREYELTVSFKGLAEVPNKHIVKPVDYLDKYEVETTKEKLQEGVWLKTPSHHIQLVSKEKEKLY